MTGGLTWRPASDDRWDGRDDAGELRGWVWCVQADDWLAARVGAAGPDVVGRRRTPEEAMALVDERAGP